MGKITIQLTAKMFSYRIISIIITQSYGLVSMQFVTAMLWQKYPGLKESKKEGSKFQWCHSVGPGSI